MAQIVRHDDERLTWEGAISLERTPQGTQPWRLPYERLQLYPFETLQGNASKAAGVRIAFETDSRSVSVVYQVEGEEPRPIDVVCDQQLVATLPLAGNERVTAADLPAGKKRVELWLPHNARFRLSAVEIDDQATLASSVLPRKRWITYGSSITHAGRALSPTRTWPAVVARATNLDLTCLGFSGQCALDPMIGRLIRDLPADYVSMCVGINVMGGALTPRTFQPAIIGLVQTIREKHPEIPLVVLSPIYSPPREETVNAAGWSLQIMREHVQEAVSRMQQCGDRNLHYVNGLEVFGPDLAHLLPDELHPDDEGQQRLGANFLEKVAKPLFV